jgi:hypothetical protein
MTTGRQFNRDEGLRTGPGFVTICFLPSNGPNRHAKRIAQLVAEADKRRKAEMVDEGMEWVKSHEPLKQ